jgi:hypothetical protein
MTSKHVTAGGLRMKSVVVAVAAGIFLAGGVARAEVSGSDSDRFMKDPPKETVYATDQHMSFSVRTSLIHWLGGVTVVKEHDLRSAERDRWWGKDVPLIPSESVREPAVR